MELFNTLLNDRQHQEVTPGDLCHPVLQPEDNHGGLSCHE